MNLARHLSISVVIPTLNEGQTIGSTLAHLNLHPFEQTIVVDGGSTDNTREQVARAPNVTLIRAPRGRSLQLNAGAAAAHCEVLLLLHADVRLPLGARRQIERTLSDTRNAAGAFRTWTVPEPHGTDALEPKSAQWLHLADIRSRYTSLPYGDQALFLRRRTFDAAGGFPELPLMEDLEFSRRLCALGRIETVRANVLVSGRRFLKTPLRYCLITNTFPLLYRLGVSPERLSKLYHHVR